MVDETSSISSSKVACISFWWAMWKSGPSRLTSWTTKYEELQTVRSLLLQLQHNVKNHVDRMVEEVLCEKAVGIDLNKAAWCTFCSGTQGHCHPNSRHSRLHYHNGCNRVIGVRQKQNASEEQQKRAKKCLHVTGTSLPRNDADLATRYGKQRAHQRNPWAAYRSHAGHIRASFTSRQSCAVIKDTRLKFFVWIMICSIRQWVSKKYCLADWSTHYVGQVPKTLSQWASSLDPFTLYQSLNFFRNITWHVTMMKFTKELQNACLSSLRKSEPAALISPVRLKGRSSRSIIKYCVFTSYLQVRKHYLGTYTTDDIISGSRNENSTLSSTDEYVDITIFQYPMDEEPTLLKGIWRVRTKGILCERDTVIYWAQHALIMKQHQVCRNKETVIRNQVLDKTTGSS